MTHLYRNDDGETVAADTAEQAGRHHDCELGGEPEPTPGWRQVPDDERITERGEDDEPDQTKTAAEWAAMYPVPTQVWSTYA